MNVAEKLSPQISEPMTWADICEQYPDQWVCLVEIDRPRRNDIAFRTARVIGHGATRRDPWQQARLWWDRYKEIGHFFTGRIVAPVPRFFV